MAQILNLPAATAILGAQLDEMQTRRADLMAQSTEIEKELGDLNPQIAKLEAVFKTPQDAPAAALRPAAVIAPN